MAYIVKYIKDFSDIQQIKQVCCSCTAKGYHLQVFSTTENRTDVTLPDTQFFF